MTIFDSLSLTCQKITVKNYRKMIHIGALESERQQAQPVIFNIEAWIPIQNTSSDNLNSVYDYRNLIAAIDSVTNQGHIDLQETLVKRIATAILKNTDIRAVRVSSEKPQAYSGADSIGVELFLVQQNS